MHDKSIRELSKALRDKSISSVELTQHFLKRISASSELNAFISVDEEHALTAAAKADLLLQQNQGGTLTGLPMAHKDIFCTEVMPTTCGSRMLEKFQSPYPATIVDKLFKAGTILLGKTNMDEFAMGSANENSYFGPVKNPWNLEYVPGGSSGGSAAAVAAGLSVFATGSDTGGSIRQPAAFCGVTGIKPTYGLVSRYGMVAYASSLDQAGPIARSAEDLAYILQVMAGFDEKDSTSHEELLPDYAASISKPLQGIRIGLPTCFFQPGVDQAIQQAIQQAVKVLADSGAEIIDIELKLQDFWVPCYYVIACAEASSNLSRYDGVRFGHRADNPDSLSDLITRSRNEGFGMEVKRRILTGTFVLSAGYFDAYYVQAQKVRRMIQDELLTQLATVDVILGPTTPTCAFKIGEEISDPTQRYLADIFTVAANLAGLPAMSLPVGFSQGLPIGMQLMGRHFSEATLLSVGHQYQQCTDWHKASPDKQRGI